CWCPRRHAGPTPIEPGPEYGQQRNHWIAPGFRRLVQLGQLLIGDGGEDGFGRQLELRRDLGISQHCVPGELNPDQRGHQSAVGHQVSGTGVSGPEQVGHGVSPGKTRKTVSSSPCNRTSNRSSLPSSVTIRVLRRSSGSDPRSGSVAMASGEGDRYARVKSRLVSPRAKTAIAKNGSLPSLVVPGRTVVKE